MSDSQHWTDRLLAEIASSSGLSYGQLTGGWVSADFSRRQMTYGVALAGPSLLAPWIPPMSEIYCSVEGHIKAYTDEAVLIRPKGGTRDDDFWVPRKWCRDGDTLDTGSTDIEIQRWWLVKKGLA